MQTNGNQTTPNPARKMELSFISWNVRGLFNKLSNPDFMSFISTCDVLCFCETWLGDGATTNIPGFNHYYTIRPRPEGAIRDSGGISIFTKYHVNINCITKSEYYIWVKINDFINNKKLYICVVYLPPDRSVYSNNLIFDEIEREIANFGDAYFLLTGDYNARTGVLSDFISDDDDVLQLPVYNSYDNEPPIERYSLDKHVNNYGTLLLSFCKTCALRILNGRVGQDKGIGGYTSIQRSGSSVVDYVLASNDILYNFISNFSIIERSESDHLPIKWSIKCDISICTKMNDSNLTPIKKIIWRQNKLNDYLRRWSSDVIGNKLREISEESSNGNIGAVIYLMNTVAYNICSNIMPIITSNSTRKNINRAPPRGWFDEECVSLKSLVKTSLRNYQRCLSEGTRHVYVLNRNRYNDLIRRKKSCYNQIECNRIVEAANNNDPKFWSLINPKKHKDNPINGDIWVTHFTHVFNKIYERHNDINFSLYIRRKEDDDNILNANIDISEVYNVIKLLRNGKAVGMDGVPNEFYKHTPPAFVSKITDIFNVIFSTSSFPVKWETGLICPVHKKGDICSADNYRPISLLPSFSKIFTSILNNRLKDWAESVLSNVQAGFRAGYSTVDNIFVLNSIISSVLCKKRGKLYTAFIDFRAAFDSIDRSILFEKLALYGINGKFINILKAMYNNVRCRVRLSRGVTKEFQCNNGLHQGCVLSPLLFSLFVNDLEVYLSSLYYKGVRVGDKEFYCLMYADDLIIVSESAYVLQKLLNGLHDYCKSCHLEINESKSKVVVFRNGGRLARSDRFFIDNKKLEIVSSFKFLGLTFSSGHSWNAAHKTLAEQATKAIFVLKQYHVFSLIPPYLQLNIFDKKILPILLYSSEVWGSKVIPDIEGVQYKFCKFILGLPPRSINDVSLGELGRVYLSSFAIHRKVKYWLRILKHEDSRFTSVCYKYMLYMSENNTPCWVTNVKQILFTTGFGDIWLQQGVKDESSFLACFLQRITDINMQTWKTNVNSMSRLSLYKLYKIHNKFEFYITHINTKYHRSLLAKFRCGCINFEINRGRRVNIMRENRFCTFCNLQKVEDEYHFLLECPCFYEFRILYIPRYYYHNHSSIKFVNLLCTENKTILRNICIYLEKALKMRDDSEIEGYFEIF